MAEVVDIEVREDRTAVSRCDEGYLRLRRLVARNRRADGTVSADYPVDIVDRPTLDAVAVAVYARIGDEVHVLTRRGLRPAALFRRDHTPALPESAYLLVEEIVAGVLEPGEAGPDALRRRVAEELREETGLRVEPEGIEPLGGALFMLPGIVSEKIHLFAAEVPRGDMPDVQDAPGEGDGSPLEEGALLVWRPLGAAIAACGRGEIEDAKTEVALRRLAERMGEAR